MGLFPTVSTPPLQLNCSSTLLLRTTSVWVFWFTTVVLSLITHKTEVFFQPCPTLFHNLQQNLTKLHLWHNIDPDLYQMLWQGICSICFNTTLPEPQTTYPEALCHLFQEQKTIGWDQVYYGRIAVSWAHHINYTSKWKRQWHNLLLPGNNLCLAVHPCNMDPPQPKPSFQNTNKY